jgi:hypothetical protein
MGSITVRIEVHPDRVEYFLGGRSAGKPKELDPEKLQGRVGFVVQGGQVTVRDARICY